MIAAEVDTKRFLFCLLITFKIQSIYVYNVGMVIDKYSTLQERYRELVIESDETETALKRRLFEKDRANDNLLDAMDRYRTKNNKQEIHITHLEHLLLFFMREDKAGDNPVADSEKVV